MDGRSFCNGSNELGPRPPGDFCRSMYQHDIIISSLHCSPFRSRVPGSRKNSRTAHICIRAGRRAGGPRSEAENATDQRHLRVVQEAASSATSDQGGGAQRGARKVGGDGHVRLTFCFPRTRSFLPGRTVITAIWRAYENVAPGKTKIRRRFGGG